MTDEKKYHHNMWKLVEVIFDLYCVDILEKKPGDVVHPEEFEKFIVYIREMIE